MNVDAPTMTIGGGDGMTYHKLYRGGGWTDNVTAAMNLSGNVMTMTFGGKTDSFSVSGTSYSATEGNGATLSYNSSNNTYLYTASDGTSITFSKISSTSAPFYASVGRATEVVLPSGNKLRYSYGQLGFCARSKQGSRGQICTLYATTYRISNIEDSFGYRLNFGYEAIGEFDPNDASSPPDFYHWADPVTVAASNLANTGASLTQRFGIDSGYQVTDTAGNITSYRFSPDGLVGMTWPGSSAENVTISYASGRVSAVITPAGTTTYSMPSDAGGLRSLSVTNPAQEVTTYTFDIISQRLKSIVDPLLHKTRYDYDGNGRLTRTTRQEGNYVQLGYDSRGNIQEIRQVSKTPAILPDIVISAAFPSSCANARTCNQPTSTTDARGEVARFVCTGSRLG